MKKNKYNSNVKNYQSSGGYLRQQLTLPKFALALLPLVIAANTHAMDLDFMGGSELTSTLDVTVGYATSFRTEDSDTDPLAELTDVFGSPGLNATGEGRTPNAGDMLTNMVRATAELGMQWRNFGLVASANYQYDHEVMKDDAAVRAKADFSGSENVDSSDDAKDNAGNSLQVLDAYVYGEFELDETPIEVRVGKQVINWGEGLFFLNGISVQNPLDFNKALTPGSDLKEVYIGNNALFAAMGIGDESSIEAYVQTEWNRTELPAMDTFFGSEALSRGASETGVLAADIEARDSGQYGLAFMSTMGDIEYGVFYSRYHETMPLLKRDDVASGGTDPFTCDVGLAGGAAYACNSTFGLSQYYAEDQDMFGVSMATTIGNWSIAAEASFRPDQALWGDLIGKGYGYAEFSGLIDPAINYSGPENANDAGTNISRHDTLQVAVNGIWLGGAVDWLGMDAQVALVQVGVETISGDTSQLSPQNSVTRAEGIAGDPFGDYHAFTNAGAFKATLGADSEAYGVAAEWIGTWNMGSTAINLDIFAQHDLAGNSHWWGNFAEGRTQYAVGVSATIASDLEMGVKYAGTSFEDSDYEDQDTLNLTANYKF